MDALLMPKPHQLAARRPSHRKQPRRDARWLVTGIPTATAIQHHGRTAYLQPHRSSDHSKRYAPGQHLALKAYVPGPTEARLILTGVRGPREPFRLGDVDYAIARELGHVRLDDFRLAWVEENDPAWWQRIEAAWEKHYDADRDFDQTQAGWIAERALERFEHRWSSKLAWFLTFRLDTAAAPRMLAAGPESAGSYRIGSDNRWHYVPRDDERESDRGYTSTDSRSLPDEKPALTDDEWKLHIGPQSRYREQDRLAVRRAEREARGWPERLQEAQRAAKAKGTDIRDERRRFDRLMEQGRTEKAMRHLALIEARVFPVAA